MATVNGTRPVKDRLRTISFFEIVKVVDTTRRDRMQQADWQQILKQLGTFPLGERILEGAQRTLIGEVLPVGGKHALKLMTVRDQNAWLEVYDPTAASIDALNLGELAQLLETSIIVFLPFGNVIGLIRGSTTAPTTSGLEEWLNGLEILESVSVEVRPMIAHEAQRELRRSSEVSLITVRAHTNQADALRARGSGLSAVLDSVRADYGDIEVEVTLRASRRDDRKGRKALREEASKILAEGDDLQIRAKARLVYFEPDESTHTEEIDFAKQRITAKRTIPTTSEDGSPIRNESAVRAILDVADEHDADLRAIVSAT